MFPSNFDPKQRGSISLLALILMTVILGFALAQFSFLSLYLEIGSVRPDTVDKDALLFNGIHMVRIQEGKGSGEIFYRDHQLAFEWIHYSERLLDVDRIVLSIEGHDRWPQPVGMWIEGRNLAVFIRDFRRE